MVNNGLKSFSNQLEQSLNEIVKLFKDMLIAVASFCVSRVIPSRLQYEIKGKQIDVLTSMLSDNQVKLYNYVLKYTYNSLICLFEIDVWINQLFQLKMDKNSTQRKHLIGWV